LLCIVVFPLSFQWAMEPSGHWFRPFSVWALMVFSVYTLNRERGRK